MMMSKIRGFSSISISFYFRAGKLAKIWPQVVRFVRGTMSGKPKFTIYRSSYADFLDLLHEEKRIERNACFPEAVDESQVISLWQGTHQSLMVLHSVDGEFDQVTFIIRERDFIPIEMLDDFFLGFCRNFIPILGFAKVHREGRDALYHNHDPVRGISRLEWMNYYSKIYEPYLNIHWDEVCSEGFLLRFGRSPLNYFSLFQRLRRFKYWFFVSPLIKKAEPHQNGVVPMAFSKVSKSSSATLSPPIDQNLHRME